MRKTLVTILFLLVITTLFGCGSRIDDGLELNENDTFIRLNGGNWIGSISFRENYVTFGFDHGVVDEIVTWSLHMYSYVYYCDEIDVLESCKLVNDNMIPLYLTTTNTNHNWPQYYIRLKDVKNIDLQA
ncbi:MAG: hypothetical protein RG740_04075 [Acholeplasmataceae bacterium]|nr:hypothetical protein [Acholeplasmataceae bacterium]